MRTRLIGVSVGLFLAVVGVVCLAVHRVDSRLASMRQQAATAGNLSFTLRNLDTGQSAASTLFEPVAAPNNYTTGAAFDGKLYLAGPGGLSISSPSGQQLTLLRTGIEIPSAPIVSLAVGHLRGEPSATLIAATHGEGILLISSGASQSVRQLHPDDARYRDVTTVLALSSGDLLIGTRRSGLLIYDGITLRSFNTGMADAAVTALAGNEGDLWIGTRSHGLLRWHAGDLSTLSTDTGLPDAQVNSLALAHDGTVLVGTPLGVAQFADGKLIRKLAPGLFASALATEGDTLFIATLDQGLHQLSLRGRGAHPSLTSIALPASSPSDSQLITGFFRSGNTLFALNNGSLLMRDYASWQTVIAASPQALADRNVSALSATADEHLLIGYFDHGLDVLDLATNRAKHVEDDHLFCINRIMPDPQRGTFDIATANGLVLLDPATDRPRQVLTRRDGLISDQVTDIAFSRSGMTLATPAGLTFFTPSGAQSLYAFQGLVNNHVYTLAAQPLSERIFAGTLGGISVLENEAVLQNITLRNSALRRNWITALARIDSPGDSQSWFVGTYGGGVMQMDAAGHVTAMQSPAPNAVINPNALLATPGHVFAGSLDDGLLVYNVASQHWTQITAGLPSRNVTAFASRDSTLYIGTDNGVVRINESRLP